MFLCRCVAFFIGEDPSITNNQLYQQADEQWELSDLGDSGIKCLPDTIFNDKNSHIINGTFPVQLQQLLDISESPYDQLQNIQNKEIEMGKEQPEFKQSALKTKKWVWCVAGVDFGFCFNFLIASKFLIATIESEC